MNWPKIKRWLFDTGMAVEMPTVSWIGAAVLLLILLGCARWI